MDLGELRDVIATADPKATVRYEPFGLYWDGLDSWRGSYDQPAIGWSSAEPADPTAGALLAAIDEALAGKLFHGYKGGEYRYRRSDEVRIDNWGEYTGTQLIGVRVTEPGVIWKHGAVSLLAAADSR